MRRLYRRHVDPRFSFSRLARQRLKAFWFAAGYIPLLRMAALSPLQRAWLLMRCLWIDWSVPHGHEPRDCAETLAVLGARRAQPGDVMIEAGCWQGGSTAKWSLACRLLGYHLHIYDSFQGVEARTDVEGAYDFSGEYSATKATVHRNVARYGDVSVCTFHEGWFCDTMRPGTVPGPVAVVYIDCDLLKGTKEVLEGVVPVLSDDGVIASQDGQIPVVAQFLANTATWHSLGIQVDGSRLSRHLLLFKVRARVTDATPSGNHDEQFVHAERRPLVAERNE
jgi:hypothetical protein